MIGNDVIDLLLARKESNIFRAGYFSKVLTDAEKTFVLLSANPEILYWIFWSMKESAYKIYNRDHGIRTFNPSKFECRFHVGNRMGTVTFGDKIYFSKTEITCDLIATVSCKSSDRLIEVIPCNILKIKKENHYPFVVIDNKKHIASVSHHGKFSRAVYLPDSQF